jgi:hypothetical protein
MSLTLNIAIATWKPDGIKRVAAMDLPRLDNVSYVVSWQLSDGAPIPPELDREDVKIFRTDLVGVANNRNNAIEHCDADIILHADDDLMYRAQGLRAVIRSFELNPEVEVATFKYKGGSHKNYPIRECDLSKTPKGMYFSMIEVATRRDSRAGELRFNTKFGPGAEFTASAEDEVFMLTAQRRGLNCRFFPITICTHVGHSTGTRSVTDERVLHGMGAFIRLSHPRTSRLRVFLKAYRMARSGQAPFFFALRGLDRGRSYAQSIQIQ